MGTNNKYELGYFAKKSETSQKSIFVFTFLFIFVFSVFHSYFNGSQEIL